MPAEHSGCSVIGRVSHFIPAPCLIGKELFTNVPPWILLAWMRAVLSGNEMGTPA